MLGWTIDTVAMVISLTSAKLLELSPLLEAWPPTRTVASEYELRSLMGKLLHVSEVVRPGKLFDQRIINHMGMSPVLPWDERFGVCVWARGAVSCAPAYASARSFTMTFRFGGW